MDDRPRMVIAGASGLIGRGLVAALKDRWRITVLTREVTGDEPAGTDALAWTPTAGAGLRPPERGQAGDPASEEDEA